MIVGIGCDIVEHQTTWRLGWEEKSSTKTRVFSKNEIILCPERKVVEFLSGRFAAKEAVLKCLSTGMHDGISLPDIEILKSESGAPLVSLSGSIKKISDAAGVKNWFITITHSERHSVAFVIAED